MRKPQERVRFEDDDDNLIPTQDVADLTGDMLSSGSLSVTHSSSSSESDFDENEE